MVGFALPPTGYYMMGWVRSDAVLHGQHTRLFARVLVLQRGDRTSLRRGLEREAGDAGEDGGIEEAL